jgi:hypothetical protein
MFGQLFEDVKKLIEIGQNQKHCLRSNDHYAESETAKRGYITNPSLRGSSFFKSLTLTPLLYSIVEHKTTTSSNAPCPHTQLRRGEVLLAMSR